MNAKTQKDPDGYVHPETNNTSRTSAYKTFTEGEKSKHAYKNLSSGKNTYSNYGDIVKEVDIDNNCPTCSLKSVYSCNCSYGDKKCENGHSWYTRRDGKIYTGDPHKMKF